MKDAVPDTEYHGRATAIATGDGFICTCLAMIVLLYPSVSRSEQSTLDTALAAYGRGELDRALEAFESCLTQGGNNAEQLVTIHVHLGVLRGADSDLESARRSFEAALALNPMLAAPSELGGQLREAFEDLRSARSGRPMRVEIRTEGSESVEVVVTNAPPGLVSTMRVRALAQDGGDRLMSRSIAGAGPTIIALPRTLWETCECSIITFAVEALDAHGNALAHGEVELQRPGGDRSSEQNVASSSTGRQDTAPRGDDTAVDSQPSQERRRRWEWYQHPALWVVVGLVVVGGVTTGVVLGTRDTDPDGYTLGAPQIR